MAGTKMLNVLIVLSFLVCFCQGIIVSPYSEGNKKREPVKTVRTRSNFGDCSQYVRTWKEWEGGFNAEINVHGAKDSPIDEWKAELELTNGVERFDSFDGQADKSAGEKFTVRSASYNSKTEFGQERAFAIQGKFDAKGVSPRLKSLKLNGGQKIECVKPKTQLLRSGPAPSHLTWPKRVLGLYILLADDTEEGFENDSDGWTPKLYDWQQTSANVLFFTFIHPTTMDVPPSFKKLSDTRRDGGDGAIPKDTVIIFAIGGYSYSLKPNPWSWLVTREAAEKMAYKVAKWYDDYEMDGIDLDLEEGAGARAEAGPNMIHFIKKLRQLQPNMIISQPTYGYPQVQAEIDVINAGFSPEGVDNNLIDAIGLMVYEGTQALNYVKNYVNGAGQWQGFPMKCRAPANSILLGAKGSTTSANLVKLAQESVQNDYLGIMVWYASVRNGFDYAPNWDASTVADSIAGYKKAFDILSNDMTAADKPQLISGGGGGGSAPPATAAPPVTAAPTTTTTTAAPVTEEKMCMCPCK